MPAMQPTSDQLRRFARDDHSGEIVMLNLLKFRDRAEYQVGDAEYGRDVSGGEAYERYRSGVVELGDDPSIGVSEVFWAPAAGFFIGEGDWDQVWAMRYPSRGHLLAMISDERYQDAHRHRDAGLLHQDLIETRSGGFND